MPACERTFPRGSVETALVEVQDIESGQAELIEESALDLHVSTPAVEVQYRLIMVYGWFPEGTVQEILIRL